jgi:hypothetical protein
MVTMTAPTNSQAQLNQLWSQASDPQIEAVMANLTAGLNRVGRNGSVGDSCYSYGLDSFRMSAELKEEQTVVHELAASEFSEGWEFSSFDHMLSWAAAMHQDLEEGPDAGEAPVHARGYYDEGGNLVPVRKVRILERQDFAPAVKAWSGQSTADEANKLYQVEVLTCDGNTLVSDLKCQNLWQ